MPKGYTTIEEIKNYRLINIKEYFKPQVEQWILDTEDYIERETGRVFIADSDASYRAFEIADYPAKNDIWIDECIEIEELKVDGKVVSEGDYFAYPANKIPKFRIKLKRGYFTKGYQNIEVKAKWGYSENVPGAIRMAATIIASGIMASAESKLKGKSSESIGPYSVTYSSPEGWADYRKAEDILIRYKKKLPV